MQIQPNYLGCLADFTIIGATIAFILLCIFKACPQAKRCRAIPRGTSPEADPEPFFLKIDPSKLANCREAARKVMNLPENAPVMIQTPRVAR